MIQTEDLCKSYFDSRFLGTTKVKALKNISFSVETAKVLIISGTKNSGKTSLMKILAAMSQPDSGKVNLLGCDLKKAANDIRRQTVYLSHAQPFFEFLNVKQHLNYYAVLKGLESKHLNEKISNQLKKWDLNPKKPVSKLSLEEKMLLSLAQAGITAPKLILMDEPAFGLDVFTAKPIFDFINEVKIEGCSLVYASSNLSCTENFGDEIIILHRGAKVYQSDMSSFKQNFGNSANDGFVKIISEVNNYPR